MNPQSSLIRNSTHFPFTPRRYYRSYRQADIYDKRSPSLYDNDCIEDLYQLFIQTDIESPTSSAPQQLPKSIRTQRHQRSLILSVADARELMAIFMISWREGEEGTLP